MRWLPFLVLFLLVYVEIFLFIKVAAVIGIFLTLVLVILSSYLGASLVRQQGMANLIMMRQKLEMEENPASEMVKNVTLLLAGVLLILPGFFTDFLGLLLLLPPIQRLVEHKMIPYIHMRYRGSHMVKKDNGHTIEGEFHRKDDDK